MCSQMGWGKDEDAKLKMSGKKKDMPPKKENPLSTSFAGVSFSSPLIGSSGTVGYGYDMLEFTKLNAFGGIITKTITPKAKEGSPFPRVCETEVGMINSIGLQNVGWENFKSDILPKLDDLPPKKIISIAAERIEDFVDLLEQAYHSPHVDLVEMNISCPNIDYGNRSYATDMGLLKELLKECMKIKNKGAKDDKANKHAVNGSGAIAKANPTHISSQRAYKQSPMVSSKKKSSSIRKSTQFSNTNTPMDKNSGIIVKLSPHAPSIADFAKVCQSNQVDGISLGNTFRGLKIDIDSQKPYIKNVIGGYSGIGIKPIMLAMVYEAYQNTDLPIIGIGGVEKLEDVIEYLLAGATLVGIGSANLYNPKISEKINKQLINYCRKKQVTIKELIGNINRK